MRTWLTVSLLIALSALSFAQVPQSSHVVLVVEGSHSYSSVIGNSALPYLNSLASQYGLATQYFANTHPAIGNSFEMTTGTTLTNDNTKTPANFPVTADNIADQLMIAGKTWKSYAEGLPSVGYTGGNTGSYLVRNNPFAYFSTVQNSDTQKLNLVPFTQFSSDLASNQLPDFSLIVPSAANNGTTGTLQQADTWLKTNIAPLLADANFQKDGLLIITFQESTSTDTTRGGGHVATVVIGPKVKAGYKSSQVYQHQSVLRTVLTALGATSFPGAAATAPAMTDFFPATTTSTVGAQANALTAQATTAATTTGVTISSPANGATVSSPVTFIASAYSGSSARPITSMRIYVDNVSKYSVAASSLNTSMALATGAHSVKIVAWDKNGTAYSKTISITVGSTSTSAGSVNITSPASGATVSNPVQFVASAQAPTGRTITSMRIYVDNVSQYLVNAASLNTSLNLAAGAHSITIQAWDSAGTVYKSTRSITVSSSSSTGTAGTLGLSSTSLDFGSITVGSSASKSLTVTANSAPVTISQVNSTSGFTVSGVALPATLAAGQSATFTITYKPTASGTVSGSMTFLSNASNSTATVSLVGTGASTTTGHSVTLGWNASTSSGISGYYVYRGTTSGSYTKLNSTPVSGLNFTDSAVTAGTTYYYVLTAVNSSGTQSSYSNQVQATIPTP